MPPVFTPVPRRSRHDGWTHKRQSDFIAALAQTGSVKHAAARVGMSSEGAYQLRLAPGADQFAAAWRAALDHGIAQLEDIALERAIHGVEVPVYSYGKLVGTRTVYNDRLIMFMLRNRAMDRFPANASESALRRVDRLRAEAENKPVEMAQVRANIIRKMDAIERHERRKGIIGLHLEGQEARDFENWRAERAERLGLPEPERLLPPPEKMLKGYRPEDDET